MAMTKIFFYEDETESNNFVQGFFSRTLISPIIRMNEESLLNKHNRINIESTAKKINSIADNSFIYIHLILPHPPYEYKGKKSFNSNSDIKDNLINYYNYWTFSNKLLSSFLSDLSKENKYRIILTGDHGFRSDVRVNPRRTFTAFYGFERSTIDNIKSVQDLGSLINSGF